jgi:hypothetical protein
MIDCDDFPISMPSLEGISMDVSVSHGWLKYLADLASYTRSLLAMFADSTNVPVLVAQTLKVIGASMPVSVCRVPTFCGATSPTCWLFQPLASTLHLLRIYEYLWNFNRFLL